MGIIAWIVLGALAGWIASMVTGTNEEMGAFANIAVGVLGAMLGGFVVSLIGGTGITGFNVWSLFIATLGAFILITLVKTFRRAT